MFCGLSKFRGSFWVFRDCYTGERLGFWLNDSVYSLASIILATPFPLVPPHGGRGNPNVATILESDKSLGDRLLFVSSKSLGSVINW